MKTLKLILLLLLTHGVKAHAFPYFVSSASIKVTNVTDFADFSWTFNGGSDQSFIFHTDQQGISRVVLRMAYPKGGSNYLEWSSTDVTLTSTGTIFQGYISRTNLPPDKSYYAEFIGLLGTNTETSAGMSLGKGRITTVWSIFGSTGEWSAVSVYNISGGIEAETDPIFMAEYTNLLTKPLAASLYATGTPLYAFTELDPVWSAASTNYATISFVTGVVAQSVTGLGTDLVARAWSTGASNLAAEVYAIATGAVAGVALKLDASATNGLATTQALASGLSGKLGTNEAATTYQPIGSYAVQGGPVSGRWFAVGNTAIGDGAFVGGGMANIAEGIDSTIGGGLQNTASGLLSAIGGGRQNTASGLRSSIGGGRDNTASGINSTIGGGLQNTASGELSTIGGGFLNAASGDYATIPGGYNNFATNNAFAAGVGARAIHDGSIVFSAPGTTNATFESKGDNTFNVRAVGGVHFLSPLFSMSDTNGIPYATMTPTSSVIPGLVSTAAANTNYWRRTTTQPTNSLNAGVDGQMTITPNDATSVWVNVFFGASNAWYRVQAVRFP